METRIAVCDSSRMRFLGTDNHSKCGLTELAALVHEQSRQLPQQITSDKAGRNISKTGGRHGLGNDAKVAEHEAEVFARQVAEYLNGEVLQGAVDRLYLLAPPDFLGLLRKRLHEKTQGALVGEQSVNLVKRRLEDIRKHLPEYL